jgi:hypothetical protein
MRTALANKTVPSAINSLPSVPDLEYFQPPPVLPGNNCNGNDKAISLDIINDESGLVITICTFLDFELEGRLSAEGMFAKFEDSIDLELDAGFVLKGALSTGVRINVTSLAELPTIEFDPLIVQLYSMQSDVSGAIQLGLLTAAVSGDAALQGEFKLGYCTYCNGTYPIEGYKRAGDTSPFYFSRLVGYSIDGGLEIVAGMKGIELVRAEIGVSDNDVFDDTPPVLKLPNAQSFWDSMKFSPQHAVGKSKIMISQSLPDSRLIILFETDMLQLVDSMLAQATGNEAFDAVIPLTDTQIKNVIGVASVLTSVLFEFFVAVKPFNDREIKSIALKG